MKGGGRAGTGGTWRVGGLTCTGPPGWARTQSAPCGRGEAAQGLCLHPAWPGTGGHGGQQDPYRKHPQFRGSLRGTTGDTHTLAFLPFAASDARGATLALPALQERGRVGDKTGHECPRVLTCAHHRTQGSRAGMLRAQPSICMATSARELGSVCPAVTNLPLDPGDRVSPREREERGVPLAHCTKPIPTAVPILPTLCPQVPPQETCGAHGVPKTRHQSHTSSQRLP